MNSAELLILKAELTNDPLSLGLTTQPSDDEANANILNEIRDAIKVDRSSVPASQIDITAAEYAGTSQSQRDWLMLRFQSGDVKPSVVRQSFYEIFGVGTDTRASFDAVSVESANRARQLLGRHVWLTPSDVANARNAV